MTRTFVHHKEERKAGAVFFPWSKRQWFHAKNRMILVTDEIFSIRNIFGCKCGEPEHHARRERKSYVEDIFRRE